jgi:hypothetical protein
MRKPKSNLSDDDHAACRPLGLSNGARQKAIFPAKAPSTRIDPDQYLMRHLFAAIFVAN